MINRTTALSAGKPRNFFLPTQAEFTLNRLPGVEFMCQRVVLPGISTQALDQKTPFAPIRHSGEMALFEELHVTFMVDEFLENYRQVFRWIEGETFPGGYDQFNDLLDSNPMEGVNSDASLLFLDSRGRARVECVIEQAFPVALTGVTVDVTSESTSFAVATASFAFTKFELRRVR